MAEALQCYAAAIQAAERASERAVMAESLRRSGIVQHQRSQPALARELCERSHHIAMDIGDTVLAAEALNALAGFDLESGSMHAARERFDEALELGGSSEHLRGRVEQNLGILANIHGDSAEAMAHYRQSLLAYESVGENRGCAIAYHNLGMVSADCEHWDDADRYLSGEPGPGLELAEWLAAREVALTGCDTWSYGPVPAEDPARPFAVPQHLNVEHGVFVVENLDLSRLAADGIRDFALVLTFPKLRGATGAWTSPIALV